MIKKIIYSILVVVFLIVITMGMLFIQIKKRNNEIYQSFLNEANQGSYDNFLKLQTKYYQQIDSYSDDYYDVIYYLLITGSNNEKTALIIVKPIKEVKFAEKITDNDDKTKALIYDGEVLVYNSKDDNNYSSIAISYGLNKLSFYYYQFELDINTDLKIVLHDYDDYEIVTKTINIDYPSNFEEFNKGFSRDEVYKIMGEDKSYLTPVYLVFSIVLIAGLGFLIVLFRKK